MAQLPKQYRITFYRSAEVRIDPFEFAWLLSKRNLEVVAKNEVPMLFVRAESQEELLEFAKDVNRQYGPLIFDAIEVATGNGYEEIPIYAG